MNNQEKTLLYKTSIILEKDTGMMKLNDIIKELVSIIELSQKDNRPDNIVEHAPDHIRGE